MKQKVEVKKVSRHLDADLLFTDIQKYLCATCSINCNPANFKNSACEIAECLRMIDNAPTADVQEVKHGRWIENGKGSLICSRCGGYSALNCFNQHRVKTEYCPDCGAIMDEDDHSTKGGEIDEDSTGDS